MHVSFATSRGHPRIASPQCMQKQYQYLHLPIAFLLLQRQKPADTRWIWWIRPPIYTPSIQFKGLYLLHWFYMHYAKKSLHAVGRSGCCFLSRTKNSFETLKAVSRTLHVRATFHDCYIRFKLVCFRFLSLLKHLQKSAMQEIQVACNSFT